MRNHWKQPTAFVAQKGQESRKVPCKNLVRGRWQRRKIVREVKVWGPGFKLDSQAIKGLPCLLLPLQTSQLSLFLSPQVTASGARQFSNFIVPTPKQSGFSSFSVFACIFITCKSHVRFIRFEAGSAIKASTRAGVGWLMRRDLDLGMIHGLLHFLKCFLCLRMTIFVRVKLFRQTPIVLGKLGLVHVHHTTCYSLLWRAQEFVDDIHLFFVSMIFSNIFFC
jgi:hypothetical protein